MTKYEQITSSEKETKQIGVQLATLLKAGDVVTLEGDLGAGKTTFTKGIAEGLNIESVISSPTFTIVKQYEGDLPLYHMDVYRLEHSDEDIGFEEFFYGDGLSIVEWAQFIEDYLPRERLNITIQYIDEGQRKLIFKPIGTYYEDIVKKLFEKQHKG